VSITLLKVLRKLSTEIAGLLITTYPSILLFNCLCSVLIWFLKKEVVAGADSISKFMKVKVDTKEIGVCTMYKDVDLGVAAKTELTQCIVSDCKNLHFIWTASSFCPQ